VERKVVKVSPHWLIGEGDLRWEGMICCGVEVRKVQVYDVIQAN
jgi:hypothetical protein